MVPCNGTGSTSACCLLGDTCLSGSTCYNYATGDLYQYGCTDINYEDESCPKKCGWDPAKSPWIGLEYCSDLQDLTDTWVCNAPESCGCEWQGSYALQILPSRACGAMGSEARVALYAPSTLLPYASLPSTAGGSTGYYSTTTDSNGDFSVISTAILGCTCPIQQVEEGRLTGHLQTRQMRSRSSRHIGGCRTKSSTSILVLLLLHRPSRQHTSTRTQSRPPNRSHRRLRSKALLQ